jgi:uncharacterized protein involved in cysteine biosynthesis
MLSVFSKSLKDFFDIKILLVSLLPITGAAVLWAVVFYVFSSQIDSALGSLLGTIPFLDNAWVRGSLELVGGVFIYYQLLIVTAVMIVGIIADWVVDRVNGKSYHLEKRGFGSLTGSILISLKSNVLFMLLFVLFLPLMFVPLINVFVNLFLWVILIKTPLFYDSLAMYATRGEYRVLKKSNRWSTFSIALASASLFLIPVVGVFIYVLQLLFFTNYNLQRLAKIR